MSNKIREKIIKDKSIPYVCQSCGNDGVWMGKIISLELHHKDGNHQNNNLENLEFLCPNCHAITDSYCKPKGIKNNFDEDMFIEFIKQGSSIRQALLSMGLSDGSANYNTAYKVLKQNNIEYINLSGNQFHITEPTLDKYCCDCGKPIGKNNTRCKDCHTKYAKEVGLGRTVERPDKEQLLEEIATSSFSAVGRKYGVSDNAIRKWCTFYGLPTHKKEIVDMYNALIS